MRAKDSIVSERVSRDGLRAFVASESSQGRRLSGCRRLAVVMGEICSEQERQELSLAVLHYDVLDDLKQVHLRRLFFGRSSSGSSNEIEVRVPCVCALVMNQTRW